MRPSENSVQAKFAEFTFRDCPKRGTSNAPSMDLASMRRKKWAERPLFGVLLDHAAGAFGTFRTVSPGTSVNKGKREGRSEAAPALPRVGEAFLLPRRWTEYLASISGSNGHKPLHLGFVGRRLRRRWNAQRPCRFSHFPDSALHTRGREDE
jgi:hypothetical protein